MSQSDSTLCESRPSRSGNSDMRRTRAWLALSLALSLTCPVFADETGTTTSTETSTSKTPETSAPAATTGATDPSAPPRADEAPAPPANAEAETGSSVSGSPAGGTSSTTSTSAPSTTPSTAHPASATGQSQPTGAAHETKPESISSSAPKPAHSTTSGAGAIAHPAAPAKPTMLYGRIEELAASTGATLQLGKMVAMTPMRDTSLDKKNPPKTLSGSAVQTFPMDFRGTWSGDLQVYSFNYDKTAWEFDRDETLKEYQILRPGTKGRTTATFYQTGTKIALQPCQVIFQGVMSGQDMMKQMQGSQGAGLNALFGGNGANIMANMQMPTMYALHLGDLTSGRGVTGNELNSQLMKNTLRQLAPDVVEQNVVTRDSDRNPTTGKIKLGYSESVLRFTRQSANRLYVQAATVNYRSDGRFQTKIILYGYLDRSSGGSYGANPYGGLNPYGSAGSANPFGGLLPGGGAGGMGGGMQAIEKMMQQMTGGGR